MRGKASRAECCQNEYTAEGSEYTMGVLVVTYFLYLLLARFSKETSIRRSIHRQFFCSDVCSRFTAIFILFLEMTAIEARKGFELLKLAEMGFFVVM